MGTLETKLEDIYGILDNALDRIESTKTVKSAKPYRPKKRKPSPKASVMPKMSVRRSTVIPEMENVDVGNVVYVPESILKELTTSLNSETQTLNNLLLNSLMPMLLSYQTSTSYARAALKEGLDVEVEFDPGLAECVKDLGYLNVVMHFIRRSRLPKTIKQRFMLKFSEHLAQHAINEMVTVNQKQEQKLLNEERLQAVVYGRRDNKVSVKTNKAGEDREEVKTPRRQKSQIKQQSRPGVRRSRSN